MYTPLLENLFTDSFFSPVRTVYVVSDSQLEEIRRKERQEELDNLETSRKRIEANYKSQIKIIEEREGELAKELKALITKQQLGAKE
tara:strand:- start:1551 stop:1811 length:261 start_codon:yes stop_codon:yes gene_type:complete